MRFTRQDAKIQAEMLSGDARAMLAKFGTESGTVSTECVAELRRLDLIEYTDNLLTGTKVWVLTARGKKTRMQL